MKANTVLSQTKIDSYQVLYLYKGQEGGLRSIIMLTKKIFPTPSYKLLSITLNEEEIKKLIDEMSKHRKDNETNILDLSSCNVLINNKTTQFIFDFEGYKCVELNTTLFTTSIRYVYHRLSEVESIVDYDNINSCSHSIENIESEGNNITCNICKEEFTILDEDTDLQASVKQLTDALNTIKFINLLLDKSQLYDIGCLIRDINKIPDKFKSSYKVLDDLS